MSYINFYCEYFGWNRSCYNMTKLYLRWLFSGCDCGVCLVSMLVKRIWITFYDLFEWKTNFIFMIFIIGIGLKIFWMKIFWIKIFCICHHQIQLLAVWPGVCCTNDFPIMIQNVMEISFWSHPKGNDMITTNFVLDITTVLSWHSKTL